MYFINNRLIMIGWRVEIETGWRFERRSYQAAVYGRQRSKDNMCV
jgi:hypothetical protein